MRLARITLDRYGAFTGLAVDLAPGLTVVHGPNEAGKSTLTHAIGDVLWGLVPRLHPYAFEFAPSRLQLTALVDQADAPVALVVTGRGCRHEDGTPVERWWVGGAVTSRQAWEVGYGVDRDRLRAGGRAVLQDGGDLADLLFQARTGVDLAAARDRLTAQAEAIWRRHRNARTVSLRAVRQRADELGARVAGAVHAADGVAALAEQLGVANAALERARADTARKSAARDDAQRDDRAHRAAADLAVIRRDIGGIVAGGDVLDAPDLARHDEIAGELAGAERALRELGAELAELDAAPLPARDPDALAVAEHIDDLRRGEDAETDRRQRLQRLHGRARTLIGGIREVAATLDPGFALADEAKVRDAAPSLVVAADSVDLLDRLADRLDAAQQRVDEAAQQVREAEAEAELAPGALPGRRAAHGTWEAARQVRDRIWRQIREPWLAGELPQPAVRATLAADLDGALAASDVAAGDAAAEAEQHVEAQTRLQERQHRADAARRVHDERAEAHGEAAGQWRRAVAGCGLAESLDVPAWRVRSGAAQRLSGMLAELAAAEGEAEDLDRASRAFHQRVVSTVGDLGIDAADPLAALAAAHRRVAAARSAETAAVEHQGKHAALAAGRARAEGQRQQGLQALAELTARAPGGDLAALVDRSRQLLDLRARERALLDQLRAAAPGDDADTLVTRLAHLTVDQVARAVGHAEDEVADAVGDLEHAKEQRTRLADELRAARQDRDAAALHQQHVDTLDEMAELARRWAKLQLMAGLLDRVVRDDDGDADAALLRHAGTLAATLTGGRVQRLSVAEVAGEARRLAVHLAGDVDATAGDLSEGTADQVFLALRLAGIRQRQDSARAGGGQVLPVVLDDVLMAYDDARTEAALGVLLDEARDQQVVLLTHHRAVADAARRTGSAVVELGPPPAAEPAPADAGAGPSRRR